MASIGSVEVVIPTDQPLIPPGADCEDIEDVPAADHKSEIVNGKSDHQKSDVEKKISNVSSGSADKGKETMTHTLSVSAGVGMNEKQNPNEYSMAKSQSEIHVNVTSSLSVSQTSKNSLMTFSSSGTFYDHNAASKKKVDLRITPKRVQRTNGKADATDFRQMEQGLLQLLEDFHSGKLEAFGQDCTFEKMENVREQQERLARLHFDLNSQQEQCGQHTDEGIKMAKRNLLKLTENLQELSHSIEKLQSGSPAS